MMQGQDSEGMPERPHPDPGRGCIAEAAMTELLIRQTSVGLVIDFVCHDVLMVELFF